MIPNDRFLGSRTPRAAGTGADATKKQKSPLVLASSGSPQSFAQMHAATSAPATIKHIAERLNVHQSTVSRALKNNQRISEDMRQKIQQLAQELGYRPDPMLSSLIAYRKSHTVKTYQANLGWITNFPTRSGWQEYEAQAYFNGANRRAAELGYKLEEFLASGTSNDASADHANSSISKCARAAICPAASFNRPPRGRLE